MNERGSVAPPSRGLPREELADYLLQIGSMLMAYGCPSYRLEEVIAALAQSEGHEAETFALPTGIFLSLRRSPDVAPVHRMTRVKEWGVNLERLVHVDIVFNDVAEKRCTVTEARARLRELAHRKPTYARPLHWIAAGVSSGAAAIFFRGGLPEILVSTFGAICIYALGRGLRKNPSGRFLVDFVGGFFAALTGWIATRVSPGISREVVVLAGAIALVPGMTLTTGLAELAQKNLVSGAARLMEAFITFLSIVSGIAFALGLEKALGGPAPPSAIRHALDLPFQALALASASLSFAVIFSVPPSYLWAALTSGAVGYVATAFATRHLPGHVAAFLAALAVCVCANGFARATQRPAQLFQLPGMMLLVPGSFGFLSFEKFLTADFTGGAEKGFEMLLIAGALVMGVLVANVFMPARKLL